MPPPRLRPIPTTRAFRSQIRSPNFSLPIRHSTRIAAAPILSPPATANACPPKMESRTATTRPHRAALTPTTRATSRSNTTPTQRTRLRDSIPSPTPMTDRPRFWPSAFRDSISIPPGSPASTGFAPFPRHWSTRRVSALRAPTGIQDTLRIQRANSEPRATPRSASASPTRGLTALPTRASTTASATWAQRLTMAA